MTSPACLRQDRQARTGATQSQRIAGTAGAGLWQPYYDADPRLLNLGTPAAGVGTAAGGFREPG